MNEWALRTLKLVEDDNYLDRLQEVYPHEDGERNVKPEVLEAIRESFNNKDSVTLLAQLLRLGKFPYDDSYVAFLRKSKGALNRNPKTVKRICDRLYSMGIEEVINGATKPKKANQRRGNAFTDWAKTKFPRKDASDFKSSKEGVILLDANEHVAKDFCNTELGIAVSKRPDLVAKSGKRYIVGEAKFSSSGGGNQAGGFRDGIGLATNPNGIAHKVFILDGVYWIKGKSAQFKTIEHTTANVLSVLLLEDFLNSIPQ